MTFIVIVLLVLFVWASTVFLGALAEGGGQIVEAAVRWWFRRW